jgi:CRP-like cAMP-binding protein
LGLSDKQQCIILPTDVLKETWDGFVMLLIVYSCLSVPVRVCFSYEAVGWVWAMEASFSLFFIIDIGLAFRTAIPLGDDEWERSPAEIARRYLLGWFWIDVPSSIPTELLELAFNEHGSTLELLRLLRIFRLVRLLRLLKLSAYISSIEMLLDVDLKGLRLFILVGKLLFGAHMMGCAFYYTTSFAADGEVSWVEAYGEGAALEGDVWSRYVLSLYWALTTLSTVGYGDITPVNDRERFFSVFALLIGAIMFAYVTGDIGLLVKSMDRQASLVEDKMDSLKEWLAWRSLPRKLSIRTRRYYEYFYQKQSVFDEQAILGDLNPQLRNEVVAELMRKTISHVSLFQNASLNPKFQLKLFPMLKPITFVNGNMIFEAGDPSTELLLLLKGRVDVLSDFDFKPVGNITPSESRMFVTPGQEGVVTFSSGGCIGESVLFGWRRSAAHVAGTSCECFSICEADIEELLRQDPVSARRMFQTALCNFIRREWCVQAVNVLKMNALRESNPEAASALFIQQCWKRFRDRLAMSRSSVCRLLIGNSRAMRASKWRSPAKSVKPKLSAADDASRTPRAPSPSSAQPWQAHVQSLLHEIGEIVAQHQQHGSHSFTRGPGPDTLHTPSADASAKEKDAEKPRGAAGTLRSGARALLSSRTKLTA